MSFNDLRTERNGIKKKKKKKKNAEGEKHSSWKITLDYFLSEVGDKFILHCNFDTRKLLIYLPAL